MLTYLSLVILAFAVSLDGFTVGAMYGLRKIRVPMIAIVIISICSGMIIYSSMKLGQFALQFLPPSYAKVSGALILMGIGAWVLYQVMTEKERDTDRQEQEHLSTALEDKAIVESTLEKQKKVFQIEIKRLGLVIQILLKPTRADLDRSGNISAFEAFLLGLALSLDSLGAGIGAALIGFSAPLTALTIALSSGSFVALGLKLGYRLSHLTWLKNISFLPGCVLIIMGMIKLF